MSNDNVIELNIPTLCDIPPERILSKAIEANLVDVVVIGSDKDGELYFAGSMADAGHVLWLMELAKMALMER